MRRPAGVTIIAALFLLAAFLLWAFAAVKMAAPELLSLSSASPFMFGLELGGPYMALLIGAGWGIVGWGLLRLQNWARWLAMLVMVVGIAWLVPKISMAELGWPVFWYGLQIAVRAAAAWYLAQAPGVLDAFAPRASRRG